MSIHLPFVLVISLSHTILKCVCTQPYMYIDLPMYKVCPAKAVPASYERKDEFWFPMDEDSWKMRNMEKTMNKLSQKAGSQQVKFVDPMGGMMMGSDGWDEVSLSLSLHHILIFQIHWKHKCISPIHCFVGSVYLIGFFFNSVLCLIFDLCLLINTTNVLYARRKKGMILWE